MSVPYDAEAEEALLSALICDSTRIGETAAVVSAADFYTPVNSRIFATLERLHAEGRLRSMDLVTLTDALRTDAEVSRDDLLDLMGTPRVWSPQHAQIVLRLSVARQTVIAANTIKEIAMAAALEPDEMVDMAGAELGKIEKPSTSGHRVAGLRNFATFVAETDATPEPWVIPGMMRRGWRAVIVAGEGSGKTVLMRQLAGAVAAGRHPLEHGSVPPQLALLVDLENPRDAIAASLSQIDRAAQTSDDYHPDRAWIETRPGGMDIRSRAGRLDLEALVAEIEPDLLCLGPVYKMYRAKATESDELAAGEAMDFLDDLRTRYGFALVLEHHAPKGSISGRDMLPHGTALWLRWPELGIKLTRSDRGGGSLDVGRWREDRVTCTWPVRLDRSRLWPWTGVYDQERQWAS